jgi:DNA-binding CsgD family transcriptional regulator
VVQDDPGQPNAAWEDREVVETLLSSDCLRPVQREILRQWSQGRTISEIGRQFRMTPAQVSDEKYRAIRSLRQHLA